MVATLPIREGKGGSPNVLIYRSYKGRLYCTEKFIGKIGRLLIAPTNNQFLAITSTLNTNHLAPLVGELSRSD